LLAHGIVCGTRVASQQKKHAMPIGIAIEPCGICFQMVDM